MMEWLWQGLLTNWLADACVFVAGKAKCLYLAVSVKRYWIGLLGMVLATACYFFLWPRVSPYLDKLHIEILGDDVVEQRLRLAEIEGVKYKNVSHALVIAKPIFIPALNALIDPVVRDSWGNHLLLASVSPFKPSEQDTVFMPGFCRLLGKATTVDAAKMEAVFEIETISCADTRADAYELTAEMLHSRRVGYLVRKDDPGNPRIPLSWKGKTLTINTENNVIVVFDPQVKQLKRMGKAA